MNKKKDYSQYHNVISPFFDHAWFIRRGHKPLFVSSSSSTFVKNGEGNKRGEGKSFFTFVLCNIGYICRRKTKQSPSKGPAKAEQIPSKGGAKAEQRPSIGQVRSCGIMNVNNFFTSPFFKRNKQKVYDHSLVDSRRIFRLIHAWSRTEKEFSVLLIVKTINFSGSLAHLPNLLGCYLKKRYLFVCFCLSNSYVCL